MTEGAADLMRWLGQRYVEAGFPGHKVWSFTPVDGDLRAAELRALGLLYFGGPRGGPWHLTEKGVTWMMANRSSLATNAPGTATSATPQSLPPMTAAAEQMMRLVGDEYEKSRFPPIEGWRIGGLRHEQKVKFELQAVGLLAIRPDGSCSLTAAGKEWIMWHRQPNSAPGPQSDPAMSRAADWAINRLVLEYQRVGYPPRETWTFNAPTNDPTLGELRARGLLEPVGPAGLSETAWRFTHAGQQWVMAHVQV